MGILADMSGRPRAVGAVLALTVAVAAGGGRGSDAHPADRGTALKVWVVGSSGPAFSTLTEQWSRTGGVEVDVESVPCGDIRTKLTTAAATGNEPDVVQVGLSLLPVFEAENVLADLRPYQPAHRSLTGAQYLSDASLAEVEPAGKLLAVPWTTDTRVLYYRTDILAAAGIAELPATWGELHADEVRLAARGRESYGYHVLQRDTAPEFTWQAADFVSGVTPMVLSGPHLAESIDDLAPELKGKWSVAPVPAAAAGTSPFAGSVLGIWRTSTRTDAALRLVDFLEQPATLVRWYQLDDELSTLTAALEVSGMPLPCPE